MLRVIIITITGCLLFGCAEHQENSTAVKEPDLSKVRFSETVRFPVEKAVSVKPVTNWSCITANKIIPIFSGEDFISFDYQDCDSTSLRTIVDQGKIEIIWEYESLYGGEPRQFENYPALTFVKANNKSPYEFLEGLYTIDEERDYCLINEIYEGIWEFNPVGYSTIPKPPPHNLPIYAPRGSKLNHEERKVKAKIYYEKVREHNNKHYEKYTEQQRINRICDQLPYTFYFFFEGEYVLKMPKLPPPVLNLTSIRYHKK